MAIVAGLLLATAFTKLGITGFAWMAPGLILFTAARSSRPFAVGYVAGLAFYLGSLYWLLLIPFPSGAISGWLALSAYLALYPAVWTWLCIRIRPSTLDGEQPALASWLHRLAWALQCAAAWVALEMIVARMLSGFPWNFLGASQYKLLPLIQISSVTGVYGVSFLVAWFSVSLCCAGARLIRAPDKRGWAFDLVAPLVVLAALWTWGYDRLMQPAPEPAKIKVALIQPSIPQTVIFDANENTNRFNKLLRLSQEALTNRPDVLIWPEASMPEFTEANFIALTNLARQQHVWLLFGADDVELTPQATNFFNASFLFDPEGRFVARYHKQRLVLFGEYIPAWLPFLKYFTPIEGSFAAGKRAEQFRAPALRAQTSILICFEDVFPHLARKHVEADTDFLLNLTNDGWFGESAAQWQHAANALFRAIENGLPLVRCTNNGLTCWIDAFGRMRVFRGPTEYAAGFMIEEIPLRLSGQTLRPTFYHQHGDWFGWSCVAVTVGLVVRARMRRMRTAAGTQETSVG
jgi:apolipoprotein N-acyltransferase